MNTPARDAALASLWAEVHHSPWAHDFFALVRRIDTLRPDAPRTGDAARPQQEAVRFAQQVELDFAPAPLARLELRDDLPPRLSVRFFGLLGPNGALPLHLTEFVRERVRQHGDTATSHFLDLFHHRLLTLFYRAWSLGQPVVHRDRPEHDRYRHWVASGTGLPANARLSPDALVFQAGLLSARSRHPEAMIKVLQQQFHTRVEITPNVGQWLDIAQGDRTRLGHAANRSERHQRRPPRLGVDANAGSRVWDRQYRFRLHMGPLSRERHDQLIPGGSAYRSLLEWVQVLAGPEMRWELELRLAERPEPRLQPGSQAPRLGLTAWLGRRAPAEGRPASQDLRLRPRMSFLHRRKESSTHG